MPAEDSRRAIYEHRCVSDARVAGMRSLAWTLAQPVVLGLPIHLTYDLFSLSLCCCHKNQSDFVSSGGHNEDTSRRLSLRTIRQIPFLLAF
jgi:hypothetical protein